MTTDADRQAREDAREERADQRRRDSLWLAAQARTGAARADAVVAAAGLQPLDRRRPRGALAGVPHATAEDMVAAAIDIVLRPPAIGSPDHTVVAGLHEHRIADAVRALRMAELAGVCADSDEWSRLMGVVRDRADEAMGTGLMGGAA